MEQIETMAQTVNQVGSVLDALQCGAAVIDRAGRLAHATPRLCLMMGQTPEALIGRRLDDIFGNGDSLRTVQYVLRHFDEAFEGELNLPRADGTTVPVVTSGRPLASDNGPAQYRVVTIIDITSQRQAYQHVAQLSDTVIEQARELKQHTERLEAAVRARTTELHEANIDSITMLAVAAEAKDEDTGLHVRRIQGYAEAVARQLGLPEAQAERIGYSAILHDVGKLHVPDEILKKPGPLTDDQRRLMQEHTVIGESILSRKPFFEIGRRIARSHHENWDGSGYPDGLAGESIPLAARIVRVVDVFDALSHPRVYKSAIPRDEAVGAIRTARGHFDPRIVEAFGALYEAGRVGEVFDGFCQLPAPSTDER